MIFTEFSESRFSESKTGNMYITSGSNKNHISITRSVFVSIFVHPSQ